MDLSGQDSGISLLKKHSLSQLKLPNKKSGTEFSDKPITPKTPTPTRTVDRLLRNCDDIGLFEELRHVNPFDETFRKAVENKDVTSNSVLKELTQEDELNTPQYPSLAKETEICKPNIESATSVKEKLMKNELTQAKQKRRSLIKTKTDIKKVIRPILPKPVENHSTKEKLKAFILKDMPQVIVEKESPVIRKTKLTNKNCKKTSETNKISESNREAAKRYRERVKIMQQQLEEDNLRLRRENSELIIENNRLKKQLREILSCETVQRTPVIIQQVPKILINNPPQSNKDADFVSSYNIIEITKESSDTHAEITSTEK